MVESIFSNEIFMEMIFPFLLVFTLVFAVLDKSKLLGDEKRQINAIVAFVVGVILIGFPYPRGVIVKLVPFLAVALVILFIFMLLYGFIVAKKDGDVLGKGLKIALGIIMGLAVVVAVLWATGAWDYIYSSLMGEGTSKIWINVLLIAIIGGAIAIVLATKGSGNSGSSSS